MTDTILHYIYDPLCGWCYAASPLVAAAADAGVPIILHGGGLWDTAQGVAPDKRAYIRQADARIAALTGVTFGSAYLDGLLMSGDMVVWSRPTTAAVLAAGAIAQGADLRMLRAIQRAHYVEGRRVVEPSVLTALAGELGLAADAFCAAFAAAAVDDHMTATRGLMQRAGLRGFPVFLLERGDELVRIEHETFYGCPGDFACAIDVAQGRAATAANIEMTLAYWRIGPGILARQADVEWGAKVIDRLAGDLQREFPAARGFSVRNLKCMRAFAAAWPDFEFVQ